jgi:GIY-YIG catalytic domain
MTKTLFNYQNIIMDYVYFWQDILANKYLIISVLSDLSGVYLFINYINGDYYVGSSTNLARWFKEHLREPVGVKIFTYIMLLINMDYLIFSCYCTSNPLNFIVSRTISYEFWETPV